ncbi:hypothetical protein RJ640_013085 [Escallonia rubra]|uniref:CCHC-type domain-containing protein n=1 Tax=Escallonia rubra TaxID=112253 RepID=A0AA88U591_9ASTE|nr:hypothetical protein RJ640_013085 [Escallonia rubra]
MERANHTMKQHIKAMSNMIGELKAASNNLTGEQQVQALICSLPKSWEHTIVNMTHNDNIRTFEDITWHLELEDKRLEAAKASESYAAESLGPNRRGKVGMEIKVLLDLHNIRVRLTKAREEKQERKKNFEATDHIVKDRIGFVEYPRVPSGSKSVYMGNQSNVELGTSSFASQAASSLQQLCEPFGCSKRDGKIRRNPTNQSHQRNNSDWNVKENPDACYECGRTGHIKKYCSQLKNKTASSNSWDFKENKFKSRKALLTWDDSGESDKEISENDEVAQLCIMAKDENSKVISENPDYNELKPAFMELSENYEKLKVKNTNLKN